MKKTIVMLLVCLMIGSLAYAETQSVKIGGDIITRALARNNYDLNHDAPGAAVGSMSTTWATFLQSAAEVEVAADLTDNVSGTVRVVNQRVWGNNGYSSPATDYLCVTGAPFPDYTTGAAIAPGTNAFDVELDLAFIELKEFLYSPLTLRIGRQDLAFGKQFIVGEYYQDNQGNLWAPEYSVTSSFDAIRATLDYSPWTIDGVFAKYGENYMRADDDLNLYGINTGYVFDAYNAEAEAYWWFKQQKYSGTAGLGTLISVRNGNDSNDVHTIGMRGSFEPIQDWTLGLEGAYQFGNYVGTHDQINERARSAWAIDAIAECRYFREKFAWKPVAGLEYIFYSGEEDMGNVNDSTSGTYRGWDPMFRGKVDTSIREFQNVFYRTAMSSSPSFTNQHQVLGRFSFRPTDSVECKATYGYFWLAEPWAGDSTFNPNLGVAVPENKKANVGSEFDFETTWSYTEDVTFGLLAGWFFPGDHFSSGQGNDIATDIVGTVKLVF